MNGRRWVGAAGLAGCLRVLIRRSRMLRNEPTDAEPPNHQQLTDLCEPLLLEQRSLGTDVLNDIKGERMSFAIYLIGYIVFIIGLAIGAHLLHVPPRWIGVGALILAGLGVLTGVARTRQRDPSN
jgi:hypothetical protein